MRTFVLIATLTGTVISSLVAQPAASAPGGGPPQRKAFQNQADYGAAFTEWSKTQVAPREQLRPSNSRDEPQSPQEVRRKIAAAVLTVSAVEPKKPRKLLVIESLAGMYHNPGIPDCDLMVDLMGKITGAWETELNNDLSNLKYDKIKQYDAVFVNSAVGEMFPDPAVRDGLSRYLKEGGGLVGIHGTPWASTDWVEFADMIGAQTAPHRTENGILKVYDPTSPIMKSFGGKDLPHIEEYYRFNTEGVSSFRWDKFRVLLTGDMNVPQRTPWTGYKRPDNIYPVTWVGSYGKGRIFYCSLGHMSQTYQTPEIVGHIFAGIQFALGDLEVDTTPNPPPTTAAPK